MLERPTLRWLALTVSASLACSLAAALGWPFSTGARLALVLLTWGALASLLAYTFLPGADLPWRVRRHVPSLRGTERTIALSFDDGPHPETTPAILETLAALGVRATFFLVGGGVERWPELARRIALAGHSVGNHTQRHRILPFRTAAQIADEVDACQRALDGIGVRARLFRPPHGFKPVGLHRALARHDLALVAWQGAIRDTDAPGVDAIVARALAAAAPGRILLLHDNPSTRGQTAAALRGIVDGLRALGYSFVTIDR